MSYPPQGAVNKEAVEALRGGGMTIQNVSTKLDEILDVARGSDSGTFTFTDTDEETLYEENSDRPFDFLGGFIDFTGCNAGAGEDTTIKVYIKVKSGGNYLLIWESASFLNAAVPDPPCRRIPNDGDAHNSEIVQLPIYNIYGIKVTAKQAAQGGGWNSIDHEWFDAKLGG